MDMAAAIQISVRQLHARTGHYLRKAAVSPVIVTDNGKPLAEIRGAIPDQAGGREVPYFSRRQFRPGFKKLMESGALRPGPGEKGIDEILDETKADCSP